MEYQVSVVVATYNPNKGKLLMTLRSLLVQKEVSVQIVIADDGSSTQDFSEAEALFAQHTFENYVIVANPQNRGTVYNILSGVEKCEGTFVKLISPGDLLNGETVLRDWLEQSKNAQFSFSDVVCYCEKEDGQLQLVRTKAHPLTVECYQNGDSEEARWNYLIYNDLILGAATLCRRDLLLAYLQQIYGKIIYAEDHTYRLMLCDNIIPHYFARDAVIYEYGSGISTSGNLVWNQRLKADWIACNHLLSAKSKDTALDRAIAFASKSKYHTLAVKLWHVLCSNRARMYWKTRRHTPRKTSNVLPLDFMQKLCDSTNKEVYE